MTSVGGAVVHRGGRFSLIWMIPIIAGAIAIYLVINTLAERGPLITITFKTGNGVVAQQTQVTHKAVPLGMVEKLRLSDDFSKVIVSVRMNREGAAVLTDHARFWVVRPRLSTGSISGLETLVSGAYIEVDPGLPGGSAATEFVGLEEPPGKRSDEPGRSFLLHASRLGSIGPGAPVFYRDVNVGEVLSYDLGSGLGPVSINIFVRDPFAKFVHENTHFWNASGLSVSLGSQGVHLELESLQSILSGGIAFETPHISSTAPVSAPDADFVLYDDKAAADSAGFTKNVAAISYFTNSVAGLGRGSPVEVFGIQIGTVQDVTLVMDPQNFTMRAQVRYDIQPERVFSGAGNDNQERSRLITASLVRQGMRAVLESSNFITGQKAISLQFVPGAAAADMQMEGDAILLPSEAGGLDNISSSLSQIATKLNKIPFEDIGHHLDAVLANFSSPEVKNALQKLSITMNDVSHMVHQADQGMTPLFKKLPQMSEQLQQTLAHANAALGEQGYGGNSDFQRSMARVLDQVNDAARSIRLLADFLDRHPEALVRGRTAQAGEK